MTALTPVEEPRVSVEVNGEARDDASLSNQAHWDDCLAVQDYENVVGKLLQQEAVICELLATEHAGWDDFDQMAIWTVFC